MRETHRKFSSRFIIKRSFQLKYTLIIGALSTALTSVWGWLYYKNELAKTEILNIQQEEISSLIRIQDNTLIWQILMIFVLQFVVLFFFGLVFTHRIAGPIYRLEQYLEDYLKTGKLEVFPGIREKDEFQRVFELLEETSKRLVEEQKSGSK